MYYVCMFHANLFAGWMPSRTECWVIFMNGSSRVKNMMDEDGGWKFLLIA